MSGKQAFICTFPHKTNYANLALNTNKREVKGRIVPAFPHFPAIICISVLLARSTARSPTIAFFICLMCGKIPLVLENLLPLSGQIPKHPSRLMAPPPQTILFCIAFARGCKQRANCAVSCFWHDVTHVKLDVEMAASSLVHNSTNKCNKCAFKAISLFI